MRNFIKKIFYTLPRQARTAAVLMREWYWRQRMTHWEKRQYQDLPIFKNSTGKIKHVLIYHISGMAFGGTEKCLQLIANSLADDYAVFFMYGEKTVAYMRKQTMHPAITFIPFSYTNSEITMPHRITGMQPHIKEIIAKHEIDLIITASAGYAHYPWNIITNIPMIVINIFGAPTLQKNIRKFIGISDTVRLHAEQWTGILPERDITIYAPLAKLPPENVRDLGSSLRTKLNIPRSDFVFGRIGRNDNNIFDPIGINAWRKIAPDYPHAHYIIMSPPPCLEEIVKKERIPRVHFLPPSGAEEDVWAFHGALDAMAHFRKDGETSGVAIAESLTVGNPIITHKSHIWNAHLEYLTDMCSLVAELDDADMYMNQMKSFIEIRANNPQKWALLQKNARQIGYENFSPLVYTDKIRAIVKNI